MDEVQNQIPQAPTPPPAPQPVAVPDPSMQTKKGGKGKIILGIVLFVILVVIGVGGWWYYAMGKAQILSSQAKFPWDSDINYKTTTDFSLSLVGLSKNEDFQKGAGGMLDIQDTVSITGTTVQHNMGDNFSGSGSYQLNYGSSVSINLSADYKLLDDTFYIKPDLSPLEMLGFGTAEDFGIANTWIEFDGKAFSSDDEDSPEYKAFSDRFDEFMNTLDKMGALGLKDPHISKDSPYGKLMKVDYTMDGSMLEEIVMAAIDSGITSAYDTLPGDLSGDELEAMISGDREEFEKFKTENPDEWELMKYYVSNTKLSAWINTKTKNIQIMELSADNLKVDLKKDQGTMSFKVSGFYEPADEVVIEKPASSMTFEQVVEAVMTKLMGGMMGAYDDPMMIDTDGDGLSDDMEYLYGTEVANPDTDGDGYLDGEEVMGGYNPLGEGLLEEMVYYDTYEEACLGTGGSWLALSAQDSQICSTIKVDDFEDSFDFYDACEASLGCTWDLWTEECMGTPNYCLCSDGSTITPDEYLVPEGCQ